VADGLTGVGRLYGDRLAIAGTDLDVRATACCPIDNPARIYAPPKGVSILVVPRAIS
jgi:hypothetical protein